MAFTIAPGMATKIFEDKYARTLPSGRKETWEEVATRVSLGNAELFELHTQAVRDTYCSYTGSKDFYTTLHDYMSDGVIITSGRHLQHGDVGQSSRSGDRMMNCVTAVTSFLSFWLLMQGCGVGRLYSSSVCRVNWDYMPNVRLVLDVTHPDYEGWIEPLHEAVAMYSSESHAVHWFEVGDSAEGWANVFTILETAAKFERYKEHLFIFDFSKVRARNTPIRGMQNRPASGPTPLIRALQDVIRIKGAGMQPWKQALYIDHAAAQAVLSGGVRRSARIAVKPWTDPEHEVIEFGVIKERGGLWSANNSIGVDEKFWADVKSNVSCKAKRIYEAIVASAYYSRSGEPGFINLDKLVQKNEGLSELNARNYLHPELEKKFNLHEKTYDMLDDILKCVKGLKYQQIVNPCGEISLHASGGYCCIGDINLGEMPRDLGKARVAAVTMAQFLLNVNKMRFLYNNEVRRTNRIGVGLIGVHEFAWKQFGFTFHDLLDENKSKDFWDFLIGMRVAVEDYIDQLCHADPTFVRPHTAFTLKPAGTNAKCASVSPGWNPPALAYQFRYVQYRQDDPRAAELIDQGYPWKDVSAHIRDTLVIGFPTADPLCASMVEAGVKPTCAGDIDIPDHFRWVALGEKYWLGPNYGNQVSYTAKFKSDVTYDAVRTAILTYMPTVKCISVMHQVDETAYAYQPETPVTVEEYKAAMQRIAERSAAFRGVVGDYDEAVLACESGACPIEPNIQ
jgi:adenosylcobalamin-dependent ribonucleoside-triphosphate reductase